MSLSDLGTSLGDRLGRHGVAVGVLRPVYSGWLRAAYGRRGLPWRLNGEPLRIDPGVRHLLPRENEPALFQFLRHGIRPGAAILDIGAFLGTYAVMEARWAGPSGRVIAFEPSPSSFEVLQRHLQMNGFEPPRAEARLAAVGAISGRRELITYESEPYRNMIAPPGSSDRRVAVDVVTVDEVVSALGRPLDWMRMDVQGLEFEVLDGARDVLRQFRGRLRIVAEMHPEQWPEYGVDPGEAADRFAALGLVARSLIPGHEPFLQSAHAILEPLA